MVKEKKNKEKIKLTKERLFAIIATVVAIIALIIMIVLFTKTDKINDAKKNNEEPINEKFQFLVDYESTALMNDDIIAAQANEKNKMMSEYNKGNYTIDNPYVVQNPYLISPQTAMIMFKTKKSEKVTITIKGKHNDDLTRTFEAAKDHYIPVLGLYGNYENEVTIKTESGDSNTIKIKVKEKADTQKVTVKENKLGNTNGEFYFATSALGVANIAYDNYGEVRWWLKNGYTKGMTMLQNGNMLLSTATEGPDVTSTSGVVELDMMGYIHHEYEVEGGYHHDGHEMPNGNLIILTSKPNGDSFSDYIVELDRESGKIVKEWDMKEIVTKVDPNLIEYGEITWGWINSITYDEKTNSLVMSLRNQNSVVSISYDKGTINWILGQKKYWSSKFDQYLLTGTGEGFIYPAGQHSVNILSDGKLSIFNNGYNSNHEKAVSCKSLQNNESYAMVYSLDLNNKTATVDYKFGGKEYFSYALSSYTYAANNHKLFNSGWHFTDKVDYNSSSCTQFSNDKYDTNLIEFDDKNNIVAHLHIDESKFEAIKADIYNLAGVSVKPTTKNEIANYDPQMGKYTSTMEADKFEELSEQEALKYAESDFLSISFIMYNNRIKFFGAIPESMEAKITFISPSGKAYRYLLKEANKEAKDFIILDDLPKGRYYVYANWDEYVYNTGQHIEIR